MIPIGSSNRVEGLPISMSVICNISSASTIQTIRNLEELDIDLINENKAITVGNFVDIDRPPFVEI